MKFICWKATKNWFLTFNILAQFKFIKYQLDLSERLEHSWLITLSFQKTTNISYAHLSILISNLYYDVFNHMTMYERIPYNAPGLALQDSGVSDFFGSGFSCCPPACGS